MTFTMCPQGISFRKEHVWKLGSGIDSHKITPAVYPLMGLWVPLTWAVLGHPLSIISPLTVLILISTAFKPKI